VEVDSQGRPAAVTWQRRELVREVVNQWRVDDDWWRVPISRTYYTLRMPTARLDQDARGVAAPQYGLHCDGADDAVTSVLHCAQGIIRLEWRTFQ
jgi:hypothetical protein